MRIRKWMGRWRWRWIYGYAYFIIVPNTIVLDLLRSTIYVSYLMTYLMIELPAYLSSYMVYTYNIYHNTEMPSSVMLIHACPCVSMRIHAYPYMSIYTYLIDVSRHKI